MTTYDSNIDFTQPPATPLGSLCPVRDPYAMEQALLLFLRNHFSTPANIVRPQLKNRIWTPNDSSAILIESIGRWRPTTTESRPALLVKRQDFQVLPLGIGDNRLMTAPTVTADVQRRVLMVGAHSIYSIARDSGEGDILAIEVFYELLKFGPLLRRKLDLVRVRVQTGGGLSLLEEATQNVVAPINLMYAFFSAWSTVAEDAPVLAGSLTTLGTV